jgi:hypothetical protein
MPRDGVGVAGQVEQGKRAALNKLNHGSGARVPENRGFLIASIKRCKARGASCVLKTPPFQACFLDNVSPEMQQEFAESYRVVMAETGIRLLDHSRDPRFRPEDFFDCDHLNRGGAIKFTRILTDELAADGL